MRADTLDRELSSGQIARVRRALRALTEGSRGPFYPRARVLRLLGEENASSIREAALHLVLSRGQHPLEEPRIEALLRDAPSPLFRSAVRKIGALAFPSAAEDGLRFAYEARPPVEDRLAVLEALPPLGPGVAKRFLAHFGVLRASDPRLVSAGLSLLVRTEAPDVDPVFGQALRHADPRNRSTALEWLSRRLEGSARAQALGPYLQDRHHRIRSTAAVLRFEDAPEDSLGVLQRMALERAPEHRAAAAWALGQLAARRPEVVPLLQRLGQDPDSRVSSRACKELADHWRRSAA